MTSLIEVGTKGELLDKITKSLILVPLGKVAVVVQKGIVPQTPPKNVESEAEKIRVEGT